MAAFAPSFPLLRRPRLPPTQQNKVSMSTSRPFRRNNRRQPPKREPREPQLPQSAPEVFHFFDEEDESPLDPDELSNVDDGFFSRYMRGRGQEKEVEELPRRRMDRKTAASAFDAVDKLFGSINANKKSEERRKWLNDVQARAATSQETRREEALDVDAEDVDRDEFAEAEVEGADEGEGERKSGFRERTKEGRYDDKYSFDTLMKIARRGPPGDSRRQNQRPKRDTSRDPVSGRRTDQRRSPDLSHLLGLTKRIIDRKDAKDFEDDYEPIDDEMEKTIEFRGSAKRKDLRRRQKYTAVRRIGGQTRRILTPPQEWLPMSEDDVDRLKSDHRSLGGKGREERLRGVVADCQECRGSGLDTCIACLGAGWVPPLKDDDKMDESRRAVLEEMWNRPNLVVDSEGEAQCVRCNGVGKQFCATCKGSGSTLRKGFSFSERDEVFDMFVNVEGAEMGHEDEDEYDDEDSDDDDDDFDSFQLYRGSADAFEFMRKKREGGDNVIQSESGDVDVDAVDDVIEVEDESAELLVALEAMHLADTEERKSTGARRSPRVSRINDDDDDDEDDDDDDDVDAVDDVDDDDDFEVSMSRTASEDLEDIDGEDDDFADLGEDDISVDVTFTGDEEEEEDGDDVNETDYSNYD